MRFLAALLCCSIIGCSHTIKNTVEPITVKTVPKTVEVQSPPSNDQDNLWKTITKSNWSYSIPRDFEDLGDGIYRATDNSAVLSFTAEKTNFSLLEYGKTFVDQIGKNNVNILSVREGTIDDNRALLLLMTNKEMLIMHFITLNNKTAYNYECALNPVYARERMSTCIHIVDNIKIGDKN